MSFTICPSRRGAAGDEVQIRIGGACHQGRAVLLERRLMLGLGIGVDDGHIVLVIVQSKLGQQLHFHLYAG